MIRAMRTMIFAEAFLLCSSFSMAQVSPKDLPSVRIILVGDSTMAVKSGYGPGFCADLAPQASCIDMAKGGRSSASYRAEGSWAQVMEALKQKGDFRSTYVLVQFGHNDQPGKPGRSTDLATEFPANLQRYVEDVRSAGAQPVLVTPLTRRSFRNGQVENSLGAWAEATKKVAAEAGVPVLDLNSDSLAAVQKMGPVEANTMAMAPPPQNIAESAASGNSAPAPKSPATPHISPSSGTPGNNTTESKGEAAPLFDYTHLGAKGSDYFGSMVAEELAKAVPELRPYVRP